VQQYLIPMRWLYPDGGHWLEELPWWPDYHNRLVRNDASLWFGGSIHSGAALAQPARYLEEPLYHLDCALTSPAAREEKVIRYEEVARGLLAPGGGSLNEHYFLPERHARLEPTAVPAEDRAAIEAALHPSSPIAGLGRRRCTRPSSASPTAGGPRAVIASTRASEPRCRTRSTQARAASHP